MSVFTHKHSLMFMFVSRDNPMWESIFGKRYKKSVFTSQILDHSTFNKWQKGGTIKSHMPDQVFANTLALIKRVASNKLRETLESRLQNFQEGFAADGPAFDLHAAAKALGMPSERAYRPTDEAIYKKMPLFPGLLYDSNHAVRRKAAEADFADYRGAWHIWIRRKDARGKISILRAAMRVRDLIRINEGVGIRCKLNFPIMNLPNIKEKFTSARRENWFSYDGWLALRDNHLSFMFERRPDPTITDKREDYFQFMTYLKEIGSDGIATLRGTDLTMSQSTPPKIVADKLAMRRIAVEDDAEILACMRSVAVVTSASEIAYAESLFLED